MGDLDAMLATGHPVQRAARGFHRLDKDQLHAWIATPHTVLAGRPSQGDWLRLFTRTRPSPTQMSPDQYMTTATTTLSVSRTPNLLNSEVTRRCIVMGYDLDVLTGLDANS
jgi:hypothetical protein